MDPNNQRKDMLQHFLLLLMLLSRVSHGRAHWTNSLKNLDLSARLARHPPPR